MPQIVAMYPMRRTCLREYRKEDAWVGNSLPALHTMSRSHYGHDLGSEIGGGAVLLGIVLLALAVYLTVKAVNLVCRVMASHSSNKLLWILLCCVGFFGLI